MVLIVGKKYELSSGRMVAAVKLDNGTVAVPFTVKCRVKGCKHYKSGYLTESFGGGQFCNKKGDTLADLRDKNFVCTEHQ